MTSTRKLAFFSMAAAVVVVSGAIPLLGPSIAMYLSLSVWAVLGPAWLATLPIQIVADFSNVVLLLGVSRSASEAVGVAYASAPHSAFTGFILLEACAVCVYPAILWLGERQIRSVMLKRLGRGRMP